MGDSWEDEDFEVPQFSVPVKEAWDDEEDEAQVRSLPNRSIRKFSYRNHFHRMPQLQW